MKVPGSNSILTSGQKERFYMRCKYCGHNFEQPDESGSCPACKAVLRRGKVAVRAPGSMIGQYRVLRLAGVGGMGEVYLCDHPVLMTRCAVKVLRSSENDPVFVERLLREARIAAALKTPDVVAVLDAGIEETTGNPYIVMEYVDGESLEEVLADGPLPESAVLGIARRVAAVLCAAEKLGIVHRDIKPANIMLTSSGDIKLADLGIAKAGSVSSTDTIAGSDILLGTPNYASPEQLRSSHSVDIRADIYSLGATMYNMLTGVRPFSADTVFNTIANVLEKTVEPISSFKVDVSAATRNLVARMMAKEPSYRPASAAELLKLLKKVSGRRRILTLNLLAEKWRIWGFHREFLKNRRRSSIASPMITPKIIIRDLLLCLAVVVCIAAAWFNFGRSYSENLKKERLSRLEKIRSEKVAELLASSNGAAISGFLQSEEASNRSRMEIFRTLINRKQDKNLLLELIKNDSFSGRRGGDFLGAACSLRNCDPVIIEELIRSGSELDRRDRYGRTPLMRAMLAGNLAAVHLLLNYGADPNLIDRDGRNVCFYLPEKTDSELLDLLSAMDVPFNIRDHRGRTALMVFVDRYDNPDAVELLLSRRVRINARAHNGDTAFEVAVRRRHIAAAEKLFLARARYDLSVVNRISPEYRLHRWVRLGVDKVKEENRK